MPSHLNDDSALGPTPGVEDTWVLIKFFDCVAFLLVHEIRGKKREDRPSNVVSSDDLPPNIFPKLFDVPTKVL